MRFGLLSLAKVGMSVLAALAVLLGIAASTASASMVAPRSKCAGQSNLKAPEPRQEDAMRCLINHARRAAGSGGIDRNKTLERAAGRKVGDVADCGLSHTACGVPADAYPRRFGYLNGSFQWGENLAMGLGKRGSARNVLQAWLNSPPHRATMLRGSFDDVGLGLRQGDKRSVWVLQLGCNGC